MSSPLVDIDLSVDFKTLSAPTPKSDVVRTGAVRSRETETSGCFVAA